MCKLVCKFVNFENSRLPEPIAMLKFMFISNHLVLSSLVSIGFCGCNDMVQYRQWFSEGIYEHDCFGVLQDFQDQTAQKLGDIENIAQI